ncbi:MAG: hypothetical protein WDN29_16035 [Methylovirgula sp.]
MLSNMEMVLAKSNIGIASALCRTRARPQGAR